MTTRSRFPLLETLALFLAAAAASSALAAGPVTAPKAAADEPIYDTYASGAKAIDAGVAIAAEKRRRVLVNFGTNDCAPCATFSRAIHESKAFEDSFKEQFVAVWVDIPVGSENEKLLARYGIDRSKGLPAIAVLDVATKQAEVSRSGEAAAAARKGTEEVRAFLLKFYRPTN